MTQESRPGRVQGHRILATDPARDLAKDRVAIDTDPAVWPGSDRRTYYIGTKAVRRIGFEGRGRRGLA